MHRDLGGLPKWKEVSWDTARPWIPVFWCPADVLSNTASSILEFRKDPRLNSFQLLFPCWFPAGCPSLDKRWCVTVSYRIPRSNTLRQRFAHRRFVGGRTQDKHFVGTKRGRTGQKRSWSLRWSHSVLWSWMVLHSCSRSRQEGRTFRFSTLTTHWIQGA